MSIRLNEKAMLVKLSVSAWTARKHDRKVSKKVEEDYNAKEAGRFNKVLIAQDSIKAISQVVNKARTYHYENTLAWGDDESRLLPSANYNNYSSKMREFRSEFELAVSDFAVKYPDLIEDARLRLNGMFQQADYPSVVDIHKRYDFKVTVNPLPDAEDFRVSLQSEEITKIQEDINRRSQEAQAEAMKDLWNRLYEGVRHMVDRLSDNKAIFRDSLITNLVELCDLMPRLNVLDDPDLERMRNEVEAKLTGYIPDFLRKDKTERKLAARDAQSILDSMAGYVGKAAA